MGKDAPFCTALIKVCQTQAEETDISISELARVVGGERALIGECGDLLSKTHKSQVYIHAHKPAIFFVYIMDEFYSHL